MPAAVLLVCAAAAPADRCFAQSAPAKPTGLTVEDGNTQVRLRWLGPNDPTITHWQYARKLEPLSSQGTASFGPWTEIPGSGSATRRHTAIGLLNNRTYRFKVRAVNAVGPGRESDEATGEPYPAYPAKPAGFRALPGDRKVLLIWDHADDVSIQGWEFRQKEADGRYGSWAAVPGSDADTTSHTVGDLENGTGYVFQIQAFNSAGTGRRSDERSATPTPTVPEKPTGFSVEAGNGKATLTWDDPGNETISKWQYAYRTTGGYGDWIDMAGSGATTVRHIVAMLENDTTHTFKIRAVNDIGAGSESDEVAAAPMARAPQKPTGFIALAGNGQVTLSWADPSDASIVKWQYAYRTTGGYGHWTDIPGSSAATTSHVVLELANGTVHTFKLRAVNEVGPGPESDEVSSTPLSVPAKPSGFMAMAGDAQAALSWDDPLNSTITGWQYSYRTSAGYGAWTDIQGSHTATTGHTVTDLSNGVEHWFKIRAVNAGGEGMESDAVAATPRAVPEKPSGFRAEAGNTQARLFWNDPGDNSISGWQYAFRTTGAYGAWTEIAGSGPSTARHTVTGLANNKAHAFRVRALNASGAGAESDEAVATPREAVPARPSGFRAEPGDGEVLLAWDDPDDASIRGWQFKSRKSEGEYRPQWNEVPGSDARTVRYTVTGLENGATYIFKIRAVNAANGPESEERSAAPRSLRPAAPTGLRARPGDAEVALAWDDPGDPAITGWQFALRTTGGFEGWTDIPGSDATTTAYTATGLENGVRHVFKLRAVNEHGGGAESVEVSAEPIPVPARPTGLAATPGDEQVMLAWDDPGDATIIRWQHRVSAAGESGDWTDIPNSGPGTVSHIVTGLDNGAVYSFRIRARNGSGFGRESDDVTAIPYSTPGEPTGFTARPGNREVLLEWREADNPAITGWEYNQRRTDGEYEEDWTYILDSGPATTSYVVPGLEIGASYVFKIRMVVGERTGAESEEATVTLPPLPARPTGLAATPGDGRVLLEWTASDDSSVIRWQYAFDTEGVDGEWIEIPGSDAATTRYEVTGLRNGARHTFRIRASNSSGFGLGSEEITTTPSAVPVRPTGLKAAPGDGSVLLEWDDPDDPSIVRWQFVAKKRGDGASDEWADMADSHASTVRHVVAGLEIGATYVFRIRFCTNEDRAYPDCSLGSDPVFATLEAASVRPAELRALKDVLASLAGRLAGGAEAVIGARFTAESAAPHVVVAGRELPLFGRSHREWAQGPTAEAERPEAVGMDGRDALGNSALQLPLGPPVGDSLLQWSLWHRGDLRAFRGSAGPQASYGGRLLSVWYGVDMRWNGAWLAGAALARSKGEVEYAAGAGTGVLKTALDSVHPYVQRRLKDGGAVWMTLGGGRGTIENATAGRGIETGNTEMASVSAGFLSPLPALGGLILSASGAAGFAQLKADGDRQTAIGSLSASTDRQNLGIEAALEQGQASRHASVSLRRDGGDGATGTGLELASGYRSPLPTSSGHIDLRMRWLTRHSERDYRELGLTATIRRPVEASRRGPSWSLAAAHGTAGDRSGKPELLWSADAPERGGPETAPALDLRVGWGFVSRGSVFTPRAALSLNGADAGRLALGLDIGPRPGPTLKFTAERRIPPAGAPESRIAAALQFRF